MRPGVFLVQVIYTGGITPIMMEAMQGIIPA